MQVCPRGDWRKKYSEQQKLQARILYVDPTTKRIMLSLQPELTTMTVRSLPNIGEVFEVRSTLTFCLTELGCRTSGCRTCMKCCDYMPKD